MSIIYDKSQGIITLSTDATSYQLKIDQYGTVLHTYYGERISEPEDISYTVTYLDRGFSGNPYEIGMEDKTYSLDILPQEYSCFGTGDFRQAALKVKNADGSFAVSLKFKSAEIHPGKYNLSGLPAACESEGNSQTLSLKLYDEVSDIEVELLYGVLEKRDVITRAVRITNCSDVPVVLQKAASMNLDLMYGSYDLVSFHGRHVMERNFQRNPIGHLDLSFGSTRGASSHQQSPFALICDREATETNGSCYGFSFMYSGEFLFETGMNQADETRVILGIHPDNFAWNLGKGETFETPEVLMAYSSEGFGRLSHIFHDVIRENVCQSEWKNKKRPVLINNWEATYFNFTGQQLYELAKEAKNLGAELFVMDDGWFGKRDGETSGLGDWYPNEEKLGCSLKELGDRITDLGILFGIWFEPECISEDSDLYRAHPDWAIQIPDRKPCLGRLQLVLDLSRAEVQDYLIDRLSSILSEVKISYVKWDFNRSICDKFSHSLQRDAQGELTHRYVLGLYRVLDTVTKRFPHVLFEGCSGGGGRFDAGMLYYTPQIWTSDNSDAIARLHIQYGTSFGFPVSSMGAHVSTVPNHQTGRVTPFATRALVAMSGTFGYELDITKLSEDEKEAVTAQIECFHRNYDLIQYGDYYRYKSPFTKCNVWGFTAKDMSSALICAVHNGVEGNPAPVHIHVKGLDLQAKYRVHIEDYEKFIHPGFNGWLRQDMILTGASLTKAGLVMPVALKEYESVMIRIDRV